ncbi:hypothetical protein B0T17DRAFT_484518 [Bombardia bombarda]|uniref:TeaA receptor TeaR n=1 Tax=Bombardia bombarda TaxID=252184 RepID=A0AA39XLJ3_9PEZI|nr:hypothetical protein B0T17DRAFT_484518 [Bombardia bombarda]
MKARNPEHSYLSPPHQKDVKARGIKDNASPADSLLDLYGGAKVGERAEDAPKRTLNDMNAGSSDPEENSKWIHRDKLAKIESEELQAAGLYLPRARERARSKSQNRGGRRDQSQDKLNGQGREHLGSRSRKNSAIAGDSRSPDVASGSTPGWDLRHPDEIAEDDDDYFVPAGAVRGSSRIPLAKLSPVPIPSEHLERDTLLIRKRDGSPGEDETIHYPKTRGSSGSIGKPTINGGATYPTGQQTRRAETSPRKTTNPPLPGGRKGSGPKPANGAAGRPRTRGGPSKDSTTSSGGATRPTTRSGERELSFGSTSKQMEGEPPWMVSAYRPDPRLPPDQQLLPTVAKRLQQERWEREGKFGSVYDKEFRPLTDDGFLKPPEFDPAAAEKEEGEHEDEEQTDWPLKTESSKSPSLTGLPAGPGRTGSYSTMPRISDKRGMSPLPSPRTPSQPPPQPAQPPTRRPEPTAEIPQKKSGGGCGCCIVM